MHLPVPPFHRLQTFRAKDWEFLAGRLLRLPEEKAGLVEAVHWAVIWHFRVADFGERGKHVYAVHDFVAHATGGNLAGPANQERRADAAFQRGKILAAPWTGPAVPRFEKLRTMSLVKMTIVLSRTPALSTASSI